MKTITLLTRNKIIYLLAMIFYLPVISLHAQNEISKPIPQSHTFSETGADLRPHERMKTSPKGQAYASAEYDYLEHSEDTGGMNIPYAGITDAAGNTYITGAVSNPDSPEGNFATLKVNAAGELEWKNIKTGTKFGVEAGQLMVFDAEENPISTGWQWNGNDLDIYTVKYDKENGDVLWTHTFDNGHSGLDVPTAMTVDNNENILIAGVSYTGDDVYNYVLLKYDSAGNLLWSVNGNNSIKESWNEPTSIAVDSDNNIALTGLGAAKEEAEGYWEGQITKMYDPNGNELWSDLQQVDANHCRGRSVTFDETGNVYVTGNYGFEIGTFKYDNTGELKWMQTYQGSRQTFAHEVVVSHSDKVYVAGRDFEEGELILISYDNQGNENWIQKTGELGQIQTAKLKLNTNDLPVVSGLATDGKFAQDRKVPVLEYAEDGALINEINYIKPFSNYTNFNRFIDFQLNDNEVYLILDGFYTEKGNVFEALQFNWDSDDYNWNYIYETPDSKSQTQLDGRQNLVRDSNDNIYVVSNYHKIENLENVAYNSIIKYSSGGQIEWENELDKWYNSVQIHVNSNDELIVAILPFGGNLDQEGNVQHQPFQVMKYSSSGALLWHIEKEVHLPIINNKLDYSFLDDQNNIYVAGNVVENENDGLSKLFLIKISDAGEELWTQYFTDEEMTHNTYEVTSGMVDPDQNIILTGSAGTASMMGNTSEILVLKVDPSGNLIWYKEMPQPGYSLNSGINLLANDNNDILLTAVRDDYPSGLREIMVSKLTRDGEEIWNTVYDQTNEGRLLWPYKTFMDSQNNLFVSFDSELFSVNMRYGVIKVDSQSGELLWDYNSEINRFYNDSYLDGEDNMYILDQFVHPQLPYKNFDGVLGRLTKIDDQGTETDEEYFYGPERSIFNPKSLLPLDDGKLLVGGEAFTEFSFFGGIYFHMTNYEMGVDDFTDQLPDGKQYGLKQNYPNPFKNFTTIPFELADAGKIKIELYDLQGRRLKTLVNDTYGKGKHEVKVDLSDLSRGIYLYQLKTGNGSQTLKMLVE